LHLHDTIYYVVHRIVNALSEQGATAEVRQTILLSATINSGVERLAGLALKESREFVDASSDKEQAASADSETLCVPDSLDQWFLAVPPKLRLVVLASFVASKCEVCPAVLLRLILRIYHSGCSALEKLAIKVFHQ